MQSLCVAIVNKQVVNDRFKLIVSNRSETFFDLRADPQELAPIDLRNLTARQEESYRFLSGQYRLLMDR